MNFKRDSIIEAIIVLNQNWNNFLVVKIYKNYVKFKDKLLINKKFLRTLFFDFLTIERHVIISQNIVANKIKTKKNANIKREFAKKKKKKKKYI